MKHLIPVFWLISAFVSPVLSQEPVCSPVFSEIFNFNIGDKFNYLLTETDATSGYGIDYYYRPFSYEIIGKEIHQDTSLYAIKGELPLSIAMSNDWPHNWVQNYLFDFNPINNIDTLILIDSANHYLNACHDSLEMFHLPGQDSIFAEIEIGNIYGNMYDLDTLPVKSSCRYYIYSDDNDLNYLWDEFEYFEVYAKRFGLLWSGLVEFEHDYMIQLTSCEIDGLVVVLLEYDDLPEVSDVQKIRVFPNPADDFVQVVSEMGDPIRRLQIWSVNGLCLNTEIRSNSVEANLNLNGLQKGIYYLRIYTTQSNFVRRLVIE